MISEKDPSPAGGRYWVRTSDLFGVNEGSDPGREPGDAPDLQIPSADVGSRRPVTDDSDAPLTHGPIFLDLNNEQADGLACIVCNADFTTTGIYSVPVGYSASTRSQVFACEAMCGPAVGYRPDGSEQMELAP